MKEIVEKNRCTGCTACMNVCPQKAIQFKINKEGFNYPIINQNKCIECGLCKKICPVLNNKENNSINNCYVGYNKNKNERLNASSGSIFSLVAEFILEDNGVVVGAAFDNHNKLKHVAIKNQSDLNTLKKSKYVQSDLSNIFNYIKHEVKNKTVLFVGTPCQVAGLKALVKSDNLITIDLFCHGVPSPKLFEKYVSQLEKENNDQLIKYDFRDNSTGWDNYSNRAIFKKKELLIDKQENRYMRLFLSDIALRECCYNCNFKLGNKYSDITLGDFWGVKNHYPDMYNKEGVSAIIINTKKGKKIFNSIKENLQYKYCELNNIITGNPLLLSSVKKPAKREKFFSDLETLDFTSLYRKYSNKVSILHKLKNLLTKIIKILKKGSNI